MNVADSELIVSMLDKEGFCTGLIIQIILI